MIVDASVAVKWVLVSEEDAHRATHLLDRFKHGQTELMAPDHIRYEVPSAITAATLGRRPRLTKAEGQSAIAEFLDLEIATIGTNSLILDAYNVVLEFGCAFYDALYVALAQRSALPFITADRKRYARIGQLPDVIWLSDYAPA